MGKRITDRQRLDFVEKHKFDIHHFINEYEGWRTTYSFQRKSHPTIRQAIDAEIRKTAERKGK